MCGGGSNDNSVVAGCAFVTFMSGQSAIEAQKALHEKRTLPGVSNHTPITP